MIDAERTVFIAESFILCAELPGKFAESLFTYAEHLHLCRITHHLCRKLYHYYRTYYHLYRTLDIFSMHTPTCRTLAFIPNHSSFVPKIPALFPNHSPFVPNSCLYPEPYFLCAGQISMLAELFITYAEATVIRTEPLPQHHTYNKKMPPISW